jgi:hypothetical protein
MNITNLIIFSIACYGLTFGWIESPIAKPIRTILNKNKLSSYLATCYHCSGFWVGVIISISIFRIDSLRYLLLYGLYSAGFCFAFNTLLNKLETKS